MLLVFLSSGLFLGWSLGANDAANVFGTAVGSKMLRFRTAAIIASIFVVLGAVIGGSGAAHTLGKLGAVNALAGSFIVAFSAGFTVFWMTKMQLPVSTSQAIVGAIIGWNFFSDSLTDFNSLTKILLTWVLCPVLAAVIAAGIFSAFKVYINRINLHMLRVDMHTRVGLIVVGAFGAYSLGANNIANVMGVFVPVAPFDGFHFGMFSLSSAQILFFIGSLAIAAGVITYSKRVMTTVGSSLMKISPVAAFVVVLAESIVLFLFSSEGLENWLISHGLPSIPLVPVSSSQAVVGAVIGIALVKGGKGINFNVLGGIASGWVTTPIIAGVISFIALFFFQNVFDQQVHQKIEYQVDDAVIMYLEKQDVNIQKLEYLKDIRYENAVEFKEALLNEQVQSAELERIMETARVENIFIDKNIADSKIDINWLGEDRFEALKMLEGRRYNYGFKLIEDLKKMDIGWYAKPTTKANKLYNKKLKQHFDYIKQKFRVH